MSAGSFTTVGYPADYGAGTNIHPIRVQPETLTATAGGSANTPEDIATATSPISAMVSGSRRGLGLHARTVRLKSPAVPPATYSVNSKTEIPAVSKTFYTACLVTGATVNYLTTTWVVEGTTAEKVK